MVPALSRTRRSGPLAITPHRALAGVVIGLVATVAAPAQATPARTRLISATTGDRDDNGRIDHISLEFASPVRLSGGRARAVSVVGHRLLDVDAPARRRGTRR